MPLDDIIRQSSLKLLVCRRDSPALLLPCYGSAEQENKLHKDDMKTFLQGDCCWTKTSMVRTFSIKGLPRSGTHPESRGRLGG